MLLDSKVTPFGYAQDRHGAG